MADRPPFRITAEMCGGNSVLAERINALIDDLYRTKEDKPQYKVPSGG